MIDTLYMANWLQNQFNTNTLGKKFLIFADEGDLVKSTKYGNKVKTYTHGLLQIVSSTLTPIKNLKFQDISMQLMLIVDLQKGGLEEHGERLQSANLIDVKQCIAEVTDRLNGQTIDIREDGRVYALTFGFGLPTNGMKMALGEIADGMPLYVNISAVLFENGVNGGEFDIIVDGEKMYFTNAVITRAKVTEQNPDYYGSNTKASVLSNGLGIDLVIPQTTSAVCEKIENEILSGVDEAYCVIIERNGKRTPYICTNGQLQQTIPLLQNVGLNLGFIEGKEETLHFEEKKWIKITKEIVAGTLDSAFRNLYEEEIVIFWGDGTKEITSEFNIAHSYNEAGIYDVYAFNKDATDSEWFEDLVNNYVIKYNLNGGVADNPVIYTEETETFTLNNPTREGYEFIGWTGTGLDGLTMEVVIPVGSQGGREYTANWEIIEYTITYNLNGGVLAGDNPTTYTIETETFWLINPTKTGYEFAGWSGTGIEEWATMQNIVIQKGSTGNREYTANWEAKEYTMYYDADGGSVNAPYTDPTSKDVSYDAKIGTLYDASLISKTVDGTLYIGNGWSIDGVEITKNTVWTWTENKTAKIIWRTI